MGDAGPVDGSFEGQVVDEGDDRAGREAGRRRLAPAHSVLEMLCPERLPAPTNESAGAAPVADSPELAANQGPPPHRRTLELSTSRLLFKATKQVGQVIRSQAERPPTCLVLVDV